VEVPHFASVRGDEREIAVLRSDDGLTWREHVPPASEDSSVTDWRGANTRLPPPRTPP